MTRNPESDPEWIFRQSAEMAQHFRYRRFRGEAVKFAQGVGFAVFDEFVRPADAFNGRVDAL